MFICLSNSSQNSCFICCSCSNPAFSSNPSTKTLPLAKLLWSLRNFALFISSKNCSNAANGKLTPPIYLTFGQPTYINLRLLMSLPATLFRLAAHQIRVEELRWFAKKKINTVAQYRELVINNDASNDAFSIINCMKTFEIEGKNSGPTSTKINATQCQMTLTQHRKTRQIKAINITYILIDHCSCCSNAARNCFVSTYPTRDTLGRNFFSIEHHDRILLIVGTNRSVDFDPNQYRTRKLTRTTAVYLTLLVSKTRRLISLFLQNKESES
jgi:hypothetical protein